MESFSIFIFLLVYLHNAVLFYVFVFLYNSLWLNNISFCVEIQYDALGKVIFMWIQGRIEVFYLVCDLITSPT